MITGARANWQTIIADLALILFMVTASSVDLEQSGDASAPAEPAATVLPAEGETLAVYRADRSGPSLEDWLALQAADDRQHLTIIARFAEGEREQAIESARDLASGAGTRELGARIVVEPGERTDVFAVLSFDGRELAR